MFGYVWFWLTRTILGLCCKPSGMKILFYEHLPRRGQANQKNDDSIPVIPHKAVAEVSKLGI